MTRCLLPVANTHTKAVDSVNHRLFETIAPAGVPNLNMGFMLENDYIFLGIVLMPGLGTGDFTIIVYSALFNARKSC
jgi:hypothetical protein